MISAMILAAGKSTRMGSPKLLLPWGNSTVLEHIISTLQRAGVEDILVVTGGARAQVDELAKVHGARTIFNERYINGEMLESIQCGLGVQKPEVESTLICLGDQPQVQERSVRLLCEAYLQTQSPLVVPSFQMRRGHPWIVARALWAEVIAMQSAQTPRDFLNSHTKEIQYVEMDTPSILADLDTPEEYRTARPW